MLPRRETPAGVRLCRCPSPWLCAGGVQYFDLKAYVSPIVNWNEFRFVGGTEVGGLFKYESIVPTLNPKFLYTGNVRVSVSLAEYALGVL
jgi:hypothetical protein